MVLKKDLKREIMDTININLPTEWSQLNDFQLKMVFRLLAKNISSAEIKTICLLRWNKIKVLSKDGTGFYWLKSGKKLAMVRAQEIAAAIQPLDFLDSLPPSPVRLQKISGHQALDTGFEGVPFETYLYADNLFQGYLHTQSIDLLKDLVKVLWQSDKINPDEMLCVMAFYWFASLKMMLAKRFHHFYQPIESIQSDNMLETMSLHEKLMNAVNGQIRALTGGDVTNEPFVMKMDTIRALTELDYKAKEVEEMKKAERKFK